MKLKHIFRCTGYPKNFVDHCIKIYLDKVFIKQLNIALCKKKELICIFPFLKKKLLETKNRLQNSIESTLIIFKSPSKNVKRFHFKDVPPKKLRMFIVLSVIAGMLFVMEKNCHCYIRAADHMGILYSTPKDLKYIKQLANSHHLLTHDYNPNFHDFTIVSKIPIILVYLSRKLINSSR